MASNLLGLRVTIIGAQGLTKSRGSDHPDTYCAFNVPGKKKMRSKTAVVLDTACPTWNFVQEFLDCSSGDSLQFAVYDKDIQGDDLLGTALLEHAKFFPDGFDGQMRLTDSGAMEANLGVKVEILSKETSIAASGPPCSLCVTIIGARNLWKVDTNGDYYCTASIAGRKEVSFKTPISKNLKSPIWNHTHVVTGCTPTSSLQFRIFERDWLGDELLGHAVLHHSRFYPDGFDDFVTLKDAESDTANLSVRVEVTKPSPTGTRVTVLDGQGFGGGEIQRLKLFCVCTIPKRKDLRFKTPVVEGNTDPVWNYSHEFVPAFGSDVSSLQFSVYHHDDDADDLLGKAVLDDGKMIQDGFCGHLALSKSAKQSIAKLNVKLETMWQGTPEQMEQTASKKSVVIADTKRSTEPIGLQITILSAQDLWKPRAKGRSRRELYCSVNVSNKEGIEFRTPMSFDAKAPSWNFTALIPECTPADHLRFRMFEADFAYDDLVAHTTVLCEKLLTDFDGTLNLQDAENENAKLAIKVEQVACRLKGLRVTVLDAAGLHMNADSIKTTGNYCLCFDPSRKGQRFSTPVIPNSSKLAWNYTHQFEEFCHGHPLHFTVYHKEEADEDILGKGVLDYASFADRPYEGHISLKKAGRTGKKAALRVKVEVLPWKGERLSIAIVSAREVSSGRHAIGSRLFCRCRTLGKNQSSFRTPTLIDTRTPAWNYKQEVWNFGADDALQFLLYDGDFLDEPDLLGKAVLTYGQVSANGFDGTLDLQDVCGKGTQATLTVHAALGIHVTGPDKSTCTLSCRSKPHGLRVTVISARGHAAISSLENLGVYCSCRTLRTSVVQFQTETVKGVNGTATWNKSCTFSGCSSQDSLELSLISQRQGKDAEVIDELIGGVALSPQQYISQGFHGELELMNSDGWDLHAGLTIRVDVLLEFGALSGVEDAEMGASVSFPESSSLDERQRWQIEIHPEHAEAIVEVCNKESREDPASGTSTQLLLSSPREIRPGGVLGTGYIAGELDDDVLPQLLRGDGLIDLSTDLATPSEDVFAALRRYKQEAGLLPKDRLLGLGGQFIPEAKLPHELMEERFQQKLQDLTKERWNCRICGNTGVDPYGGYCRGELGEGNCVYGGGAARWAIVAYFVQSGFIGTERLPFTILAEMFQQKKKDLLEDRSVCSICSNIGTCGQYMWQYCCGDEGSGCEHGKRAVFLFCYSRLLRLCHFILKTPVEKRKKPHKHEVPDSDVDDLRSQSSDGFVGGDIFKGVLRVTLVGARGLAKAKTKVGPHPICICHELAETSRQVIKSNIVRNTRNPDWNFCHEIDFDGYALQFDVYDTDIRGSPLGSAKLLVSSFDKQGFQGGIELVKTRDGNKAKVLIKVEILSHE